MCATGTCPECRARMQRVALAKKADEDPRHSRAIFTNKPVSTTERHYSYNEALQMLLDGKIKEGDILFPILIDIVGSGGEVG